MMKGTITAESVLGQGSKFRVQVELPLCPEKDIRKSEESLNLFEEKLARKSIHLLLVEDNTLIQIVERKILEKEGFQVDIASNGQEALDKVEQKADYDLILCDLV